MAARHQESAHQLPEAVHGPAVDAAVVQPQQLAEAAHGPAVDAAQPQHAAETLGPYILPESCSICSKVLLTLICMFISP